MRNGLTTAVKQFRNLPNELDNPSRKLKKTACLMWINYYPFLKTFSR